MKKQVDQSGRLEDARATVWAYADGGSRSLLMPAAVKRRDITFGNIGKGAQAHDVAWKVFIGQKKPDRKMTWSEVKKVL